MASPMAPENVWMGYVALSSSDKKAFDDLGELRPEIFDYPGVGGKFIPLDTTVEDAMETALLQCTSAMFEVTASATTWHVLKVSFIGGDIADLWLAGKLRYSATQDRMEDVHLVGELHGSPTQYRLECRSPIKAEWLAQKTGAGPQVEVFEVVLRQMYFDDWGDRVLSAQWSLQKSRWTERCEGCMYGGRFTWRAEGRFGGGSFCAECWHAYCKNASYIRDSLHVPRVQRRASPQPADDFSSDGQGLQAGDGSPEAPLTRSCDDL